MPLYDYQCMKCENAMAVEVAKPISEASKVEHCDKCGEPMLRIFSGTFAYGIKGDNSASVTPKRSRS